MIYFENDVINLTRGDDATLDVQLQDGNGNEYTMTENEYLIFGIREQPIDDSSIILEIHSDNGSNVIKFTHDLTQDIDVGFYSAEIQLMTNDGQRVTVWPKLTGNSRTSRSNRKNFCLMTEVIRS